jgi:predicted pyridoxine 5'-phosphate oxidase superfamily flavin-nucleotide-binding protein
MGHRFMEIAFTANVKREQAANGSRSSYARGEGGAPYADRLGPDEADFISKRDSFYMASVSETGWPYQQHRGGPEGFLKVLDEQTLAFADYRGNRQYITVGNVRGDDRVSLILVDYPNRRRLKILGRATILEGAAAAEALERVATPGYKARVERAIVIRVEAFDWNCPQHITPRYTEAQVRSVVSPLQERIQELERQLAALRPVPA